MDATIEAMVILASMAVSVVLARTTLLTILQAARIASKPPARR